MGSAWTQNTHAHTQTQTHTHTHTPIHTQKQTHNHVHQHTNKIGKSTEICLPWCNMVAHCSGEVLQLSVLVCIDMHT